MRNMLATRETKDFASVVFCLLETCHTVFRSLKTDYFRLHQNFFSFNVAIATPQS